MRSKLTDEQAEILSKYADFLIEQRKNSKRQKRDDLIILFSAMLVTFLVAVGIKLAEWL
jgi:hypothetical protein